MKLGSTAAVVSVLVALNLSNESLTKLNANAAKSAGDAGSKAGAAFSKRFGASISSAGVAVSRRVGVVATAALGALFKAEKSYDDAGDRIRSKLADSTEQDVAAVKKSFDIIAKTVPATMEQISAAVAAVASESGLRGGPLETLTSQILNLQNLTEEQVNPSGIIQLARAFNQPVTEAAKDLDMLYVAAAKSGMSVDEFASTMKSVAPIAKEMGLGFTQTAALTQNLTKAGVNASVVFAGLRRYSSVLAKEGKSAAVELPKQIEQLQKLVISNPVAAKRMADQIFGKASASVLDAMAKGSFNLADAQAALDASSGRIAKNAAENADGAEAWQVAMNTLQITLKESGTQIMPLVTEAIKSLTPVIIAVLKSFNDMSPSTRKAIFTLLGLTAAVGPMLVVFGKVVGAVGTVVRSLGVLKNIMFFLRAAWIGLVALFEISPFGAIIVGATLVAGLAFLIIKHWQGVKDFFAGLFDFIKNSVKAVGSVLGVFGGIFGGNTKDKPEARATGGQVSSGKAYLVGEKGPEIIVPRSAGSIVPNYRLGRQGGNNMNYVINVYNPTRETSSTSIPRALRRAAVLKGV
jgi:phage-related minor tail protein